MRAGLELVLSTEDISQRLAKYDFLKDRRIIIEQRGEQVNGIARGFDQELCLRVELDSGELVQVSSGTVQLF